MARWSDLARQLLDERRAAYAAGDDQERIKLAGEMRAALLAAGAGQQAAASAVRRAISAAGLPFVAARGGRRAGSGRKVVNEPVGVTLRRSQYGVGIEAYATLLDGAYAVDSAARTALDALSGGSVLIDPPLECTVLTDGGRCGRPAAVGLFARDPEAARWLLTPVCQQCSAELAEHYKVL